MKIRMVEQRSGPRHDGRMWPNPGDELDVDDEEGADVCAAGWAVPVPSDPKVEKRAETPQKRSQSRTAAKDG